MQADITTLAVDAIVNAANRYLSHGGGVAWAIAKRGGSLIQQESDAFIAKHGPLQTGEAVITGGGDLPAQFVIHAVGPVWGEGGEDHKLRHAIRNALRLADENNLKSVAFPAISTGTYHFPVDRAARLMLTETKEYLEGDTGLQRVIFCLYDDATYRAFEQEFNDSAAD